MIKEIKGKRRYYAKIEIVNPEELIKQHYPPEFVENLIYQVLILSM